MVWFILPDLVEGVPCGGGGDEFGNEWIARGIAPWGCADLPLPPCPKRGDANESGAVNFEDLLAVLANFGPRP